VVVGWGQYPAPLVVQELATATPKEREAVPSSRVALDLEEKARKMKEIRGADNRA
jgi:hypothetical protein